MDGGLPASAALVQTWRLRPKPSYGSTRRLLSSGAADLVHLRVTLAGNGWPCHQLDPNCSDGAERAGLETMSPPWVA